MTDTDNREVLEYDGGTGAVRGWYAFGTGPEAVPNRTDVAGGTRRALLPDIRGSFQAMANFDTIMNCASFFGGSTSGGSVR